MNSELPGERLSQRGQRGKPALAAVAMSENLTISAAVSAACMIKIQSNQLIEEMAPFLPANGMMFMSRGQ